MTNTFFENAPIALVAFGLLMTVLFAVVLKDTKRWIVILSGPLLTFTVLVALTVGFVPDSKQTFAYGFVILAFLGGFAVYWPSVFIFAYLRHRKKKALTNNRED
ncbi:MAG: hypothetical protein WCL23_04030 [Candidatus Moraniibacteriota bacterium]